METYPADEFAAWLAFRRIRPSGDDVMDARFALLASLFVNAFRGKNKPPVDLDDFMIFTPKRKQTPEEMMAVFLSARDQAERYGA